MLAGNSLEAPSLAHRELASPCLIRAAVCVPRLHLTAMEVPPVSFKVCVGNLALPGEYAECEIQGEPPEKKMVLEVFLTGRQTDVLWMEKALKLGGRSFLSVPFKLLKEINGLLQDRR